MKIKININNITEYIKNCKSLSGVVRSVSNNKLLLKYIIDLTNYLDINTPIIKRLFYIKHDYNTLLICEICNKNEKNWSKNIYKNTCKNKDCIKEYVKLNWTQEKENNRREKIKLTKSKFTQEQKDTIISKIKHTNLLKYGKESYAQTKEFKEYMINTFGYISPFELKDTHDKSKQTLINRTGYNHNFKIPEIKENRKQTFIKNYGFNTPAENPDIKQKIIDTNQEKYNSNSPLQNDEIKKKSIETLNKNYGVNSPLQNKDILTKFKKTMLDTYGYEYWLQDDKNREYLLLKSFQYKKYIFNNKTIYLQGYEDYVLFNILNIYNDSDIIINNSDITKIIGEIYYIGTDNNKHKYYPDFYIKSINKIIEVKSKYTYNKDINNNLIKEQACKDMGLNFEFIIIEKTEYNNWRKTKQK